MESTQTDLYLDALSQQIKAEIAASPYKSIRAVARELDEDYSTFYRWVNNTPGNPIRMKTVLDIVNLLGVPVDAFFKRVQDRAEVQGMD